VKLFNEMNEKALEYMARDEPETALEYLKKVLDTLEKIENQQPTQTIVEMNASVHQNTGGLSKRSQVSKGPNHAAHTTNMSHSFDLG